MQHVLAEAVINDKGETVEVHLIRRCTNCQRIVPHEDFVKHKVVCGLAVPIPARTQRLPAQPPNAAQVWNENRYIQDIARMVAR